MGKENAKEIFRKQFAVAAKRDEILKYGELLKLQDKEREEKRLILKFDTSIIKDLQTAINTFLEQEPTASILGIFDSTIEAIAERRNKKISTTRTDTYYYIEPLGYVNKELKLENQEKMKITRFIEGKTVETSLGTKVFEKKSVVDLINGFGVKFNADYASVSLSLSDGFLNMHIGNEHNRIALENLNLENLSESLVDAIIHEKYTPPPVNDNWGTN